MSKVFQGRTCIGCGAVAPQAELLRLASDAHGRLAVDERVRTAGRGGYLHRDHTCWDRFAQRKGPVRSLRTIVNRAERAEVVARLRAAVKL